MSGDSVRSVWATTRSRKEVHHGISSPESGLISFGLIALLTTLWYSLSDVMRDYPYLFVLGVALCMGELTVSHPSLLLPTAPQIGTESFDLGSCDR